MRIPKVFLLPLWLLASALPSTAQVAPCVISDVAVDVGDCTSDSTFEITLDFKVVNPTSSEFEVFGNGVNLGTYDLNQLPLTIKNFPTGAGLGSFVRVCLKSNSPNGLPCCGVKQFFGPNCSNQGGPCKIYDIEVGTGDCQPDGQYKVKLDFKVKNPTSASFEVQTSNGTSLGVFPLTSLPITLTLSATSQPVEVLVICLKDNPDCCQKISFAVPPCPPPPPCVIRNLRVQTGDCTSDSTYKVKIHFTAPAATPGTAVDSFDVYSDAGIFLGRYALSALPLTLDFPWNGKSVDALVVCLKNSNCCRRIEFNAPECVAKPCGIGEVKVEVGECLSPKRYRIKVAVKFPPTVPPMPYEVGIWSGDGTLLGTFSPADFPVSLIFPASGDEFDRIKICLLDSDGVELCCKVAEFKAPNCDTPPCPISDLKVEVAGPCNPADGTYPIVVNFNYSGPIPAAFGVWAGNGKLLGIFPITALPVKIAKFPASGKDEDKVRVCLINANAPSLLNCCLEAEFKAPDCQNTPCGITNIKVEAGPCNPDGTYRLVLSFTTTTTQGQFALWAGNGQFLGIHPLSALPIKIPNFPASGKDEDAIRICLLGPAGTITNTCCVTHEFKAPDCSGQGCKISDLTVKVGDCNDNGTFKLHLNFKAHNAGGATKFILWVNGAVFGTYGLSQLPLTIPNFPGGNGDKAEIRVCLVSPTAPDPSNLCCASLTFVTPNCSGQGCKIEGLSVKVGDCNSDGTYQLTLDFDVSTPLPLLPVFGVWANGKLLGTYSLSDLPLTISHFPASGKPKDEIKVCILTPGSAQPLCCAELEFKAPNCQGHACKIEDLEYEVGDCNDDGTYRLKINFKVVSTPPTPATFFGVWGNGVLIGTYPLSALPLTLPNFPSSGGDKDKLKVCIVSPNSMQPSCCAEAAIEAPDCAGKPCKIWEVQVLPTPCLCGQFFAVLTFRHKNGGAGGFEVIGTNGDVYGTFPYSQPQPIILGPFDGDGTTLYSFLVRDKNHPNCADGVKLGAIDCPDFAPPAPPTAAVALSLSPNPATQWVTVMARSQSGAAIGQVVAEVRKPDGRLMRTEVVPNGNLFTLNVAELPAGIYRLSVQTVEGRYESTFVKQ